MAHDQGTVLDRHRRLACPLDAARPHFASAAAIRAWFGIHANGDDRSAETPNGDVTFRHVTERWNPAGLALTVHGQAGGSVIDGYLTVRSIAYAVRDERVIEGTEIWVHTHLRGAHRDRRLERTIAAIVDQGLHHIALELDTRELS